MSTLPSRFLVLTLLLVAAATAGIFAAETIPPIPPIARVLPPEGLEIPADVRSRLEARLAETRTRLAAAARQLRPAQPEFAPDREDIEVFLKAVELALLHREFYVPKDFEKADWALAQANQRLDEWSHPQNPVGGAADDYRWSWKTATGLVVRGYRSFVDGSAQPYGLVIPKDHDFTKPCPLYVWLHGRGDKNTDLHFLYERATRPGQIAPPNAIVVHPFGRQCLGYKHAGEQDVLDVSARVARAYNVDQNRIVLMGFSMGGAGAWHLGAHYTSNWVAVSPGAGFVDTARYQKITPDRYPEWYVQKLWGQFDVPNYVRNLFNTQVVAYSGENDPQRAAAVLMEEAFKAEGRTLTHLIGPGVEHKYEPATLQELLQRLAAIVAKGKEKFPAEVHLQTRTLRYRHQAWVAAERLEEHWLDSRIDAKRSSNKIEAQTKNIARFSVTLPADANISQFVIDGKPLPAGSLEPQDAGATYRATFVKRDGNWAWLTASEAAAAERQLSKRPGVQGPIDDIFSSRFLVVTPSGKSKNPRFQAWVDFEIAHFRDRWRALMRGEPPLKRDHELTDAEMNQMLVLFGDPDSNSVMAKLLDKTPVTFKDGNWTLGGQAYSGDRFVPSLIFPRPVALNPRVKSTTGTAFRYVVLNSGLTFREAHDRTNSQQNPKLPDWAVIDLSQLPDANAPGRIHDAGFFDEHWQFKSPPKAP